MDEPIVAIYPLDSPTNRGLPGKESRHSQTGFRSIGVTQSKGDNLPI